MSLDVITPLAEPYGAKLREFVHRLFPSLTNKTSGELLDAVTDAVVASGAVRLGPRPSPESLVAIREVLAHWIGKRMPIPFVVPWGSEKPDGSAVDIAELSALKTLATARERIQRVYEPGAVFNLRLEDASAPHLFYERAASATIEARVYVECLTKLLRVLGFDFIVPRPESLTVTAAQFAETADSLVPLFRAHLRSRITEPSADDAVRTMDLLADRGWRGGLPDQLIEFYLRQYEKLYPDKPIGERLHILSRYFAASWARGQLGIRGESPEWGGKFIDLSFVAPPPGVSGQFARRVVYRTIPESITTNHMPPWRAKGYLVMTDGGAVRPRLASFQETRDYNPCSMTLTNGAESVEIRADYVVE